MVQKSQSQPPGMVIKPVVNHGITYQPQLVFTPGFLVAINSMKPEVIPRSANKWIGGKLLSGSLHWVLLIQIKGVSMFVSHLAISFIYRGRVTYVTWKSGWHLMMYICTCRYLFAGFLSELSRQTWSSQRPTMLETKKSTPPHFSISPTIYLHCYTLRPPSSPAPPPSLQPRVFFKHHFRATA